MEKFLDFWSHYNAAIIECLVALILISVIYIAYRTFFGPRGPDAFDSAVVSGGAGHAGIDTVQIEKTLQKILEQQSARPAAASPAKAAGDGSPASAELIHEVSHLKKTLEERDRQIVTLKEQADTSARALAAATSGGAAAAAAAPAAASSGFSESERAELLAKIKELEARLAEYEIISEDIADVSFFKEENARLNRELEALKAGGAIPAAPVEPVSAEPLAAAPPEVTPVAPVPEAPAETPAPAPAVEVAASPVPEASPEAASAIDDSLMAEFARAVEGQKEGTLEQPSKTDEDAKLLEEFENFSKKS
jgi:hypothetical protein